jgi:hypothetical protein
MEVYLPDPPAVILVDLTAYTGAGTTDFHFCSGVGCVVGGIYYEPRISNPGSLKLMMFADATTSGPSQVGFGEVVLLNPDGGLDVFLNYGLDGRSLMISKLVAGAAILLMSCSMEQPTVTNNDLTIRVKDPQTRLEVPIQVNKYAGSNVLPSGEEGVADIQGKEKPLTFGSVFNATPILVNTSKLIYQGNDGALQSIPAVYDKGVALQVGAAYSSLADMEANAPAPGYYRAWLGGGYFRLGSSPAGQVTFDGVEGATVADRTAAQIAKRIVLRTLLTGDLVLQDFTDLDTLNSAEVGIFINTTMTINAALDQVLGSIGGWHGFDAAGKFNVGRLDAPSGIPVLSLTNGEITSLASQATNDSGRGVPAWEVSLNYAKNYTVQNDSELAGNVLDTPASWVVTTLPVTGYWQSVTFGNGVFVAVGVNAAAVSKDGKTWAASTIPAGTWYTVAFGNGVFIAVGPNGVVTSNDGVTWTARTIQAGSWRTVTYGNGLFMAVAYGGQVSTSTDGITWITKTAVTTGTDAWSLVTYGAGIFLTFNNNTSTVKSSADGVTWVTNNALPISGGVAYLRGAYGNNLFVISVGNDFFLVSKDGLSWLSTDASYYVAGWRGLCFIDGVFTVIGRNNTSGITATSTNGLDWTTQSQTIGLSGAWQELAYGSGTMVAICGYNTNSAAALTIAPQRTSRQWLAKEFRTVTALDSAVLTAHLLAPVLTVDTLLISSSAAQTEANRLLALNKVRRDFISVECKSKSLSAIPNLGSLVQITYPRFGYNTGKLFIMLGFEMHLDTDDITLYLWG